jgi:hypothetical protein
VIFVYQNRNPDKAELPMREGRKAADLLFGRWPSCRRVQKPRGALGFFNRVPRTGGVKKSKTRNVLFSGENLEREEEKTWKRKKGWKQRD